MNNFYSVVYTTRCNGSIIYKTRINLNYGEIKNNQTIFIEWDNIDNIYNKYKNVLPFYLYTKIKNNKKICKIIFLDNFLKKEYKNAKKFFNVKEKIQLTLDIEYIKEKPSVQEAMDILKITDIKDFFQYCKNIGI